MSSKEKLRKKLKKPKKLHHKLWHFFWHDDSAWSWLANLIVAFILIKFLVYPGLGLIFGTSYPIVAVISESMEHSPSPNLCGKSFHYFKDSFSNYWQVCGSWYQEKEISKEEFQNFPFKQGFYKGDLIIVLGAKPESLQRGDVLIFQGNKPQPIIHRLIKKWQEEGNYYFQTKGDHNPESISGSLGETKISEERLLGKGILRIPYLGWIKIIFVQAVKPLGWEITR